MKTVLLNFKKIFLLIFTLISSQQLIAQTQNKENQTDSYANLTDSTVHNSSIEYIQKGGFGVSLATMTGIWIPTGDLSSLGLHPELGVQLGLKTKRLSIHCTALIKFLNAANSYLAKDTKINSWVSTKSFFGPYLGLDIGANFLNINNNEFQLLMGLGYDAFTALDSDYGKSKKQNVESFNFNFGLGYNYYYNDYNYIGVEAKYNIVDYSKTGITNFTDNFISLRFVYGFVLTF